jgi:hypothetical protein
VYLFELIHGEREEVDKLLLILVDTHAGDLRQTLQCHVAEHGHVQELGTDERKKRFVNRVVFTRHQSEEN